MKRYTGQFVVAMGNGFCTLRCVVGNVPGALCFHGRDSSSELRSLREEQAGQLHRPGHAGAMSLEADEATGEKPSLTLFLAGSAAW